MAYVVHASESDDNSAVPLINFRMQPMLVNIAAACHRSLTAGHRTVTFQPATYAGYANCEDVP